MDLGFVIGIWTTTFRFCIPSTGPQNSGHPGLCHSARCYTKPSPQGLSASEGRGTHGRATAGGRHRGASPNPQVHPKGPVNLQYTELGSSAFNAYHTEEPWLGAGLHLFWSRTHTLTSTTILFNDPSARPRLGQLVGN